ncbi:MAG: carboxypeptidase regulatory-like domain-containing protein [Candidatus Eisenbacteria bacterium]|uniref:Carboxypeptidase regulatory-like domain-containing protein n=1 Tax=Eiseniibacteriota bacterium TaxID=2212470 RepID=A0A956LZL3_UNCEI|nr:carboxypeptidase regulatory-like domain-containing protein [Candidatus Eisenbacteria bacterium]
MIYAVPVRERRIRPHRWVWLACLALLIGCSDGPSDPSQRSAPLAVRVVFADPEARPVDGLGRSGGTTVSLSELTARAVELGEANRVRDEETVSLDASQNRFRVRLAVPPAPYYRVEIEARGTRTSELGESEFGLAYFGQGFAMDVSAETEQTVEVLVESCVPRISGNLVEGELTLSWPPVTDAARYRLREVVGGSFLETPIARTDTTISIGSVSRSFRVRAELENGLVGAYSEPVQAGEGSGGDLRVTVVDAQTADPLSGAQVTVQGRSVATNGQGIAELAGLSPGSATVVASLEGYAPGSVEVTIVSGQIVDARIVLSRIVPNGYRFILTWGAAPADLDSYLVTPAIEDSVYVIFYQDPGSETATPFAYLDRDDTDGFGPETITIFQNFPGSYHYFVNNYSGAGSGPLAGSGATVSLVFGDQVIRTVTVPTTGEGEYWDVLTLDGISGVVTIHNEIRSDPPPTGARRAGLAKRTSGP